MPFRRSRRSALVAIAAAALLLAACNGATDEADTDQAADELPDDLDDLLGGGDDLPDPTEQIEDGVFRGEGIILPIPDGFELDPAALMQGIVAALNDDGTQQLLGQAVNTDDFPDPLDIDDIAAENEAQFGSPSLDEEIDIEGATRARQLRFDEIPSQQQDAPALTAQVVLAEDGAGELAFFQYVAASDEFEDGNAEQYLAGVGFDPDSSPPATQAPQAP